MCKIKQYIARVKTIKVIAYFIFSEKLNTCIKLIEWMQNQKQIDKIVYDNLVLALFAHLYSISEILNCKNEKNEFNPFYIWAYYFDKEKHYDMRLKEDLNLLKKISNLPNDHQLSKLVRKIMKILSKPKIKSEDLGNHVDEFSRREITEILMILGSNNSRNEDFIDSIHFNLREKFIEPIEDNNLGQAVKFWGEYIKPFLVFLLSNLNLLSNKNKNELWKEYVNTKGIIDDKFQHSYLMQIKQVKK